MVAGAVVFGFLDAVAVVASAFDDAGVGALAVLAEDAAVGDVGGHAGEGPLAVVRGKKPGRRPGGG